MAVLMTKDKNEMIVTCDCGCMASYHMKIYKEGTSQEIYGYMSFLKSNFEDEQYGPWNAFKRKVEKIWNILRGKDYCYSDTIMTQEDFEEFKKYINQF